MKTRIISLGEIIIPDFNKTIGGCIQLIIEKNPKIAPQAKDLIGKYLVTVQSTLNKFKLGQMNEKDFDEEMISIFKTVTETEISVDEFNNVWSKMQPSFADFETSLKTVTDYHSVSNQKIIFISFTNPKDIEHLKKELESNNQLFDIKDNKIFINEIELRCTYLEKKSKAKLIEEIIKEECTSQSTPFLWNQPRPAIIYIRGYNNINDPILSASLEQTNAEIDKKLEGIVPTNLWNKKEQTLADLLSSEDMPIFKFEAAKL